MSGVQRTMLVAEEASESDADATVASTLVEPNTVSATNAYWTSRPQTNKRTLKSWTGQLAD